MDNNRKYIISLTGQDSHTAFIPRGQGSFSIGTRGISKGKYDIWVEKDSVINWDAFNGFYTGHGETCKERYPYGDWPRWFYYSGNDTGFIEWSSRRGIEEFHWSPQTDTAVDFTNADIYRLFIHTEGSRIQFSTGEKTKFLWLSGTLEDFDLVECVKIPALVFHPDYFEEKIPYRLPVYRALAQATCIEVDHSPVKTAFDCTSLLQFPNLKSLDLSGNLTNLHTLTELKELEALALRYVPDLQDMPGLESWNGLKSFIGYNIEETAGKALRVEVNKLKKERTMGFTSVTKLRKPIWFVTEYGMPFSGWEEQNAKKATRAYKSCFNRIKKAETEEEVHEAVIEFVKKLNRLEDMETTEREDAATAINQLMENSSLDIPPEKWMLWFDEARDF